VEEARSRGWWRSAQRGAGEHGDEVGHGGARRKQRQCSHCWWIEGEGRRRMVAVGAGRARGSGGFSAFYSEWRLGLLGTNGDAPRRPYRRTRGEHREAYGVSRMRAWCASSGGGIWELSRAAPRVQG
jgi:hypothetical protein